MSYPESLSVGRAARTAAVLFLACGVLVAVAMPLASPLPDESSELGVLLVALAAIASGVVIWFLPWSRWGRGATLALVPHAFLLISLFNVCARQPYLYAIFFLIVYVWIGLFHPRWTSLASAPLLAVAYLAPFLIRPQAPVGLRSLAVLLPVCLVLGETVGWVAFKLRQAEAARVEVERELRASETRFRTLLENSSDVVSLIGANGELLYHYPPTVLGYGEGENLGRDILAFVHPDDQDGTRESLALALQRPGIAPVTACRIRDANGGWRWFESVAKNCLSDPQIRGLVINSRDITDRRLAESRLAFQALHDSVTGLPNRDQLLQRMDEVLAARWLRPPRLAVLFFDLDGFKLINDNHGHAEGDLVLVAVADRLRRLVRPPDVLARFGGDQFAVLCPEVRDDLDPLGLATSITEAMAQPLVIGSRLYHLSVSIGLSFGDRDHVRPEDLLRDADVAMCAAKRSSRARVRVFDDELRGVVVRRLELEQSLRGALERGELAIHYQPEVELAARRIRGAEALLRWRHGVHGLLDASEFIPLADETRLIVPIGDWLLRQACLEVARWDRLSGDGELKVAINLSACELVEEELPGRVESALDAAWLEPSRLCLEITERSLMEDEPQAARIVGALKEIGVTLALDDFGTRYSSLDYLRRFPVDRLKIDRSFIAGLGGNGGEATIVRGVIELAERLGMESVAEGVETAEQHAALVHLGCTRAQGRYYGAAVDGDGFGRQIERSAARRSTSSVVNGPWPASS